MLTKDQITFTMNHEGSRDDYTEYKAYYYDCRYVMLKDDDILADDELIGKTEKKLKSELYDTLYGDIGSILIKAHSILRMFRPTGVEQSAVGSLTEEIGELLKNFE